jgi:solute carrier family 25 protein 44
MYSVLTVILHPLTVAKIRRQILMHGPSTTTSTASSTSSIASSSSSSSPPPIHPSTATPVVATATTPTNITSTSPITNYIRQYYRGLGVVVSLAIPARIIYISTLEYTREWVDTSARHLLLHPPPFLLTVLSSYSSSNNNSNNVEMTKFLPLITPLSGGIAGGLAAVSSQLIVVPMDVISQKLIVMDDSIYNSESRGRAMKVARKIVQTDGWRGLYKGFGLSLFTSLPAGSIWWGTYAGIRSYLNTAISGGSGGSYSNGSSSSQLHPSTEIRSKEDEDATMTIGYAIPPMARQGIIQIVSAFGAAAAAAVVTQPLDTLKTRLQVGNGSGASFDAGGASSRNAQSFISMAKELTSTSGMSGLYKGLLPRIVHMGVWGSVLSAAYEVLKLVSRKDFEV